VLRMKILTIFAILTLTALSVSSLAQENRHDRRRSRPRTLSRRQNDTSSVSHSTLVHVSAALISSPRRGCHRARRHRRGAPGQAPRPVHRTASLPGESRKITRANVLIRLRGVGFTDSELSCWVRRRTLSPVSPRPSRDKNCGSRSRYRSRPDPFNPDDVTIDVVREPQDLIIAAGAVETKVDESFSYRGFAQGIAASPRSRSRWR